MRKIILVECEDCDFAVGFEYPNEIFYFCKEHKFGVNVPNEDLGIRHYCNACKKEMEKYELYDEDNTCPICNSYLAQMYRFE